MPSPATKPPEIAKPLSVGQIVSKLQSVVPEQGEFASDPDAPPVQEAPAASPEAPQATKTPELPLGAPEEAKPAPSAPEAKEAKTEPEVPVQADPWAEYEEVEYEDGADKYKVRAPKSYAEKVKQGYANSKRVRDFQAAMSRATGYLGKYEPVLKPLIEGGRFDDLAAMIQLGESNETFRNAMYDAYYRAVTGKPLTFADQQILQQAGVAPTQPVPAVEDPNDVLGVNAAVRGAVEPFVRDMATLRASFEAQQRQQQQVQQQQQYVRMAQAQTESEFAAAFPDEFSGDPAKVAANFQEVYDYAQKAGMFQRYNPTNDPRNYPTVMRMAKLEMDRYQFANAPSSAAASAGQVAEQAERQAREAVAQTLGGSPITPAQAPKPSPRVSLTDEKGRRKSLQQIAQEKAQLQAAQA